ncbi:MAG: pyridoxal-phosphate dependent enzyme [Verrucomicrobia bacterium]|nr:pyridoxal-phosphate dependent enzyme [Verrucomicrobiota bacterium]
MRAAPLVLRPDPAAAASIVTLADVRAAHRRIYRFIHRTPVLTSETLDARIGGGAHLLFKCENFQKVGAFKARGAQNAIFQLAEAEAASGVVTHSSGNHAAAVALAARRRGIPAHIVMPRTANRVKKAAVVAYGGRIVECDPTQAARESAAEAIRQATGAALIPPYDDERIIAGQGTCALEFLEQAGPAGLDLLLVPVGGGGLLAGTAVTAKAVSPATRVIGCEPAAVDDAARGFACGVLQPALGPRSIADGLLTALGNRNFIVIRALVDEVVTVSEQSIIDAMRLVWQTLKIIIEPSAAVPVAALLEGKIPMPADARSGIILTGGNVDLDKLPW